MKNVTESIFSGKSIVIPMAEVSHIEKMLINDKNINYKCYEGKKIGDIAGITIITKHTTWNAEQDSYNNSIWLIDNEAEKFLKSWCNYRHELEFDDLKDIRPKKVTDLKYEK